MAVGTFQVHDTALFEIYNQARDLKIPNHYAVLIDVAHTPDPILEDDYADISSNEILDADYAAINIGVFTITQQTGFIKMDLAIDADFGNSVDIAAKYLYILEGDNAAPVGTDRIIGHLDLDLGGIVNVTSTANDFDIIWHLDGVWQAKRSA